MPNDRVAGRVELRDAQDGEPQRIEGLAVPYNTVIRVPNGRERFVMGAFAEQVEAVNRGERLAYLTRHGADGGVVGAAVDRLWEDRDGLHFAAQLLEVPEAQTIPHMIRAGINGVSAEFVRGLSRMKGDIREHFSGVRLAAIAGSYAPAYQTARVALRSVGGTRMPNLSVEALTERRDAIESDIVEIRGLAETEDRQLTAEETTQITTLEARRTNVDALIAGAEAEAQRAKLERRALPSARPGSPAVVTREETIYGPGRGHSYFADLVGIQGRDVAAAERMTRHRALITDLAQQIESRAVVSGDLAGAYPTQYYPDLYVPDIAYSGPFGDFFAVTPITAPNPIVIPAFASVTGDTDVQGAENDPLDNVDVETTPRTLTPKSIGGETIVSRQAVDGASPGTDVIIGTQLRELLMRDTEREIELVLAALAATDTIADTVGTDPAQSGADLHRGFVKILGQFFAGAAAGGAGARMLPAEGIFPNATSWGDLIAGEDGNGRPLMPFINPQNAQGTMQGQGFQSGVIGGTMVTPAWALLDDTDQIVARRNDARQWKSAVLDVRLLEREGPQSVVFAVFQYFGFAVLEPKGVRRYTYTDA